MSSLEQLKQHAENSAAEYQELKKLVDGEDQGPQEAGRAEINAAKNRYADIVPYDANRCVLPAIEGQEGSDYINASLIKGYHGNHSIIAAMGPKKETVGDFYRLLWHYKVKVLLCLTGVKEEGKEKCFKYWPQEDKFGDFEVKLVDETYPNAADGADFCLRTLRVKHGTETRDLKQYHYHTWPDKGVPEYATPSLQLLDMARGLEPCDSGVPLLIHCSAGCGRTGAFCAIDFVRSQLKKEGPTAELDLQKIVADIRRQRPSMVQVADQYKFLYDAAIELLENIDQIGKAKASNVIVETDDAEEKKALAEQVRRNREAAAANRAKGGGGCCVMM
eukprot:m.54494 g.54494  ORF g.54494 m.54494 type:complete len:333 (-) comp11900_c0_seq3:27-1025(-)